MGDYPAPAPAYLGPPRHFTFGDNKPINRIVIHSTVSPCKVGGARAIAAYFRGVTAGGSAHYVVDPGEVVQVGYDSVICWHAPPNRNSLGVELCDMPFPAPEGHARWLDAAHLQMLDRAARLTAELCLAYDVPLRRVTWAGLKLGRRGITSHAAVSKAFSQSSHWDPGAFPWRRFIKKVRHEAALIQRKAAA